MKLINLIGRGEGRNTKVSVKTSSDSKVNSSVKTAVFVVNAI